MDSQTGMARDGARVCPFDHHDPSLAGDRRYAIYAGLREHPVNWTDAHGGYWILTHHADVEAATKDAATYSCAQGVFWPRAEGQILSVALEQDPPVQAPFRRLYTEVVGRSAVSAAEGHIRSIVRAHLDAFAAAGGGDFVALVASRVPVEVVAHLVGLGPRTAARVRHVTEQTWKDFGMDPAAPVPLLQLFFAEIDERRHHPADDFLTRLVNAEIDGRPITDDELGNFLLGAVVAGHETTMNGSANLAYQLAQEPALQNRLRGDPTLIPEFVEESLRHRSPVQNFLRVLVRDIEIGGVTLRAGDRVMLLYGAANRDERRFPDGERFDVDRADKRHLAFGGGVHRCVGAHLGQTEMRLITEELIRHEVRLGGGVRFGGPSGGGAFLGIEALELAVG